MSVDDFTLARESVEEILDTDVDVTENYDGSEQRRAGCAGLIIGFKVKSPALTSTQYTGYRAHFLSAFGQLTKFYFTSPFDGVKYYVRYVKGSFKSIYSAGVYRLELELKRINA